MLARSFLGSFAFHLADNEMANCKFPIQSGKIVPNDAKPTKQASKQPITHRCTRSLITATLIFSCRRSMFEKKPKISVDEQLMMRSNQKQQQQQVAVFLFHLIPFYANQSVWLHTWPIYTWPPAARYILAEFNERALARPGKSMRATTQIAQLASKDAGRAFEDSAESNPTDSSSTTSTGLDWASLANVALLLLFELERLSRDSRTGALEANHRSAFKRAAASSASGTTRSSSALHQRGAMGLFVGPSSSSSS